MLTKPADGKAEDGKLAEIPIPEIRKVATYERDYRPHHRLSRTYLRNRTFGAPPSDVVEYDLDNEDEDWLTTYNDGQNRLPAEKFEAMIWKLEVCCGEATETAMELRAAVATEKGQIISYQDKCAAMAGTEALPKEKALELLKDMSGRPAIMEAVYDYWCAKRSRTGKPCLRRLQPPRAQRRQPVQRVPPAREDQPAADAAASGERRQFFRKDAPDPETHGDGVRRGRAHAQTRGEEAGAVPRRVRRSGVTD